MTLSLLPLAAFSILTVGKYIKNKAIFIIFILIFSALSFKADYYALNDFANAPIPNSDKEQYINSWPAGGGLKEIISFLEKEAQKGKIYVASEGTFGSLPTYGVEIYLGENKNIDKRGIWPLPKDIPNDLLEKAKTMPVFFVFNNTQEQPGGWPLELIAKYQKGIGNSYMNLYKVVNN